jgi:serine protease Do
MPVERKYLVTSGLCAAALLTGAIGWSLSPLLPSSPLQSRAGSWPIAAKPASWQGGNSIADIVEQIEPSVVSITVEQQAQPASFEGDPFGGDSPFGDFMQQFMGPGGQRPDPNEHSEALGSGFVVDDRGDILTNNHVVEGGTRFTIEFSDKSIAEAKLVGTDPQTDLALLHVDKMPAVRPLVLADSDHLRVGDPVIAIGDPYGVGQTVTAGVVSARGRSLGNSSYVDYIQTDAPINQGNSGGPLLNYSGEVVGVNSAIYSPSGGNVGIGFAVPSNNARQVVDALRREGKVTRAWLGVGIQDVTPAIAAAAGLAKAEGAIITSVEGTGPSAGKLEAGDIVTGFNGASIHEARDLSRIASAAAIGKDANLQIIRQGQQKALTIRMGRLAKDGATTTREQPTGGQSSPKLGVTAVPLDDGARESLGLNRNATGVVLSDVAPDGPAGRAGLQRGDVIEKIGGDPVRDNAGVANALSKSRNDTALILINRDGIEHFVAVPLS